jgi:hypothetical protein
MEPAVIWGGGLKNKTKELQTNRKTRIETYIEI